MYYAPTIDFKLVDSEGWTIIAPKKEWVISSKRALLPEYFSYKDIAQGVDCSNYFYCTYKIDGNNEIALFLNYTSSFFTRKTVYGQNECAIEGYSDTRHYCQTSNKVRVILGINRVRAQFDNSAVYFIIDNTKVSGQEIKDKRGDWINGERISHSVYDLSSEEVLQKKQADLARSGPYCFPNFYFLFEGVSCADLENAIFVIDGLSSNGKKLPTLKVRLNYFNFNEVPKYQGPEGGNAQ